MASKFPENKHTNKISNEPNCSQDPELTNERIEVKVELDAKSIAEVHELITKAKFGKFPQVWNVLDKKPHYINHIPEKRAWGVLHQAAYLGRKEAVIKALSYPQCDPFIKTNQDLNNEYGSGRTADELTQDQEIKSLILEAQNKCKLIDTKVSQHLKENIDYQDRDKEESKAIAGFIALGDWDNVVNTLMSNSHLINVVCQKTGLTVLHEFSILNNLDIVTQLLAFPASDPCVETVATQSHAHGAGKIPEQLTESQKVLDVILDKKKEINQLYLSPPTYVLPWKADSVLLNFFLNVLEDYSDILSPSGITSDMTLSFPSLLQKVFTHIDTDSNWVLAKREVSFQIRNFAFEYSQRLDSSEDKLLFYANIIQIYTREDRKMLYPGFNCLFKEQIDCLGEGKSVETDLRLGIYGLVLNALLMYWKDLEICNNMTYRGIVLEPEIQTELVEGYEFTSLNFLSCSRKEALQKNFKANCMLVIDNSTECIWSPKLICKYASKPDEGEYLYPCGARFRVIRSAVNFINLKLIVPQ